MFFRLAEFLHLPFMTKLYGSWAVLQSCLVSYDHMALGLIALGY